MRLFAAVATAQWAILLGPIAATWLWLAGTEEDRSAAVAAAAAAALGLAIAAALSFLIVVPRPFMDVGATNYLNHVRDSSFPSDHATLAFAFAVSLWRRRPPTWPTIWLPLLLIAVAVGWARIFLGAHYPSDIAGGALVAAIATAVGATPPGRAAQRLLIDLGEGTRSAFLAAWRRVAPHRADLGGSDQ